MAYVVRYGGQVPMEKKQTNRGKWKWTLAAFLLLAAAVARYYWGDVIASVLIPGEDAVTAAAFSNFVENLGQGRDLGDCVTTFCAEVIYAMP